MVRSFEHGSARFVDYEGAPIRRLKMGKFRLVVGHPVLGVGTEKRSRANRRRAITASPERHMLTIAPTRSGKGTASIIPNLLTYPGSVFVIDPKGENAWVTAERRRQLGQEVFIIDPWGEVAKRYGAETSARFNPMAGLDPKSPDFADDLAGLADAIVINQGKDPHWDDSARELVAGLIAFLVEDPETRTQATLGQVRRLLTLPRAQIVALIREAVKRDGVAARKLARFSQDTNEISSIVSTATTQTAFLDNDTLTEAMSVSDLDFARLAEGKVSVYLVIPADKLGPYGRWLRLLVTIAIRAISRAQRLKSKVLFLLDEFGTVGRLATVEQAFGLMGGMGICLWPFVQDLNQLKRDYPDSWETFVANAEVVQAFGIKDNFSADYLSQLLGVKTEEVISQATYEKRQGSLFRMSDPKFRSMHDKTMQRALMFPDEIRSLRSDWQLILYRGIPVMGALMPYHQTSAFNGLYRPLPDFRAKAAWPAWPNMSFDSVGLFRHTTRTLLLIPILLALFALLLGLMGRIVGDLGAWRLAAFGLVPILALLHLTYWIWRDLAAGTWIEIVTGWLVVMMDAVTPALNDMTGWDVAHWCMVVGLAVGALVAFAHLAPVLLN